MEPDRTDARPTLPPPARAVGGRAVGTASDGGAGNTNGAGDVGAVADGNASADVGGGRPARMADLVAATDWSATPLGPADRWPAELRTAVGICLGSRFPMFVWWGPQLVNLYNDAYVPILGKRHPTALGRPAADLWAEVWDVIGPQVEVILAGGPASWAQRVPLTVERNGYPEQAYFTWSHSPIPDAAGGVGGILCVVTEETAAVLAERERGRLSEQARTILESITDAFFALGPDWRFTYVNPQAEQVLGRKPGDLLGRDIWDVYPGLHGSEFERVYRRVVAEQVALSATTYYPDHDKWYEVHAYPAADGGLSIYFRDVTEGKRAEAELRETSSKLAWQTRLFEGVASTTPDFIYVFGLDGRILYANRRLLEVWGRTYDQTIGRSLIEVGYEQWHADMHLAEIRQVIETKRPIRGEVPFTGGSGISGVYEYIFTPVFGPDGTVEVIAGTTRDITARRQAERELTAAKAAAEASLGRWQAVVGSMAEGVVVADAAGNLPEWNPAALAIHGYASLAEVGRHLNDFPAVLELTAADTGRVLPLADWPMSRVLRGETFAGFEASVWRRDVDLRRVLTYSGSPVLDPDGRVRLGVLTFHDVTDARRADAERSRSEAWLRLTTDAIPVVIAYVDADQRYRFNNAAYQEWMGLCPDELAGRHVREVLGEETYLARLPYVERALAGELVRFDGPMPHRTKGVRDTETSYIPDLSEDGRTVRGFVSVVYDITERREADRERERLLANERASRAQAEASGAQAEASRAQAETSRAQAETSRAQAEHQSRLKDEFLATLSHELRTPLNAILGWAQILRTSMTPEDVAEGVDVIIRNARVQVTLIEELLDVSRIVSGKVRLDVQRVPLAAVVEGAVETVRPAAEAKGVLLEAALDPRAGPVAGDQSRLTQIVFNLVSNAIKYTPRGERVRVRLERVSSHVEVTVADTGEGITADFLPHVFERFRQADGSTTRRHGGLGLGLSIVKQLAELHGGTVRAASDGPGKGASFVVALPLMAVQHDPDVAAEDDTDKVGGGGGAGADARRRPAATGDARDATNAPDGLAAQADARATLKGFRVLVVDDESDARAVIRRLLEGCGAVVQLADSAAAALVAVRRDRPDALVSDVGMPGEDGYSLIRQVRALPPGEGGRTPAVALTAYARSEDRTKAMLAGFDMHLSKPVEPAELIATVATLARRMQDEASKTSHHA